MFCERKTKKSIHKNYCIKSTSDKEMTKLTLTTICCMMLECFKSSIHTTIRVIKDIRSSDGIMILKEGLSSGLGNTNTDANYSESNSQVGSFSNRSSRSSSSAMRGLELPEEEMSSRLSQSLLQASLLSYKDNSASSSQYSHSHRSNSTRSESENSSKYMYGHFCECKEVDLAQSTTAYA